MKCLFTPEQLASLNTQEIMEGIRREFENQRLYAYFNFSGTEQSVFFDDILTATDLISGKTVRGLSAVLQPYGFLWLLCD